MITINEVRAVIAEELEIALAPIREAIARLGDVHGQAAAEDEARHSGARKARQALLRREAQIRADHGGQPEPEFEQDDLEASTAPQVTPEDPPAPVPRRPARRHRARECPRCMGPLARDEHGLRCPASGCEDVVP